MLTNIARIDEEEIESQVDALRKKLLAGMNTNSRKDARGLKSHQVHDLAEAKMGMKQFSYHPLEPFLCTKKKTQRLTRFLLSLCIAENDRFGKALGISADYEEGSHWRRQEEDKLKRQEEQAQQSTMPPPSRTSAKQRRDYVSPKRSSRRDDTPSDSSSDSGSD